MKGQNFVLNVSEIFDLHLMLTCVFHWPHLGIFRLFQVLSFPVLFYPIITQGEQLNTVAIKMKALKEWHLTPFSQSKEPEKMEERELIINAFFGV